MVVIPRESGVSSTPQLFRSITGASEYWVARSKPGDDGGECGALVPIKYSFTFPRRIARESCMNHPPRRAWGMPGGQCTGSLAGKSVDWSSAARGFSPGMAEQDDYVTDVDDQRRDLVAHKKSAEV